MARPDTDFDAVTLDDLDLGTITHLRTDRDGDLVVFAETPPDNSYDALLVRASKAGDVKQVGPTLVTEPVTAFSTAPDGYYALAYANWGSDSMVVIGTPEGSCPATTRTSTPRTQPAQTTPCRSTRR